MWNRKFFPFFPSRQKVKQKCVSGFDFPGRKTDGERDPRHRGQDTFFTVTLFMDSLKGRNNENVLVTLKGTAFPFGFVRGQVAAKLSQRGKNDERENEE